MGKQWNLLTNLSFVAFFFSKKLHGLYHILRNQATIVFVMEMGVEAKEKEEEKERKRRRTKNYCLLKYSSRSLQQRIMVEVAVVVVAVGIQTGSGFAHIVLLKTHIMADLIVKSVDFLCSSYLMQKEGFRCHCHEAWTHFCIDVNKRKKEALATCREREEKKNM